MSECSHYYLGCKHSWVFLVWAWQRLRGGHTTWVPHGGGGSRDGPDWSEWETIAERSRLASRFWRTAGRNGTVLMSFRHRDATPSCSIPEKVEALVLLAEDWLCRGWRFGPAMLSKHHASFCYLSGSEPYRGFRNMRSLLEQTVCYR